jgi:osmotically-inducible protein OsmY
MQERGPTRPLRSPRYIRFPGVGLRRPDAAIAREIEERLKESAGLAMDDVHVSVRDGEVTLRGVVRDLRLRHLAGKIADDTDGVVVVRNRLGIRTIAARRGEIMGRA